MAVIELVCFGLEGVKGSRDGRIGWKRYCSVVGGGGRGGEGRQKSQFNPSN